VSRALPLPRHLTGRRVLLMSVSDFLTQPQKARSCQQPLTSPLHDLVRHTEPLLRHTCQDNMIQSVLKRYSPSPLWMHSLSMENRVIWCPSEPLLRHTCQDNMIQSVLKRYSPSPLWMHSLSMENRVIWCPSLAAIDNTHRSRCLEGSGGPPGSPAPRPPRPSTKTATSTVSAR
jgi:hypothetical protein